MCVNYQVFLDQISLDIVFGSEPLDKAYDIILDSINTWRLSRDFVAILHPSSEELNLQKQARIEHLEFHQAREKIKESRAMKAKQTRVANMGHASVFHLNLKTSWTEFDKVNSSSR